VTISRYRRTILCAAAAIAILMAVSAASQPELPEEVVRVERTISTAYALPGSTFRVTLRIEPLTALEGVGLHETVPLGWMVHPVDGAGAAFKRSVNEWVFTETLDEGAPVVLMYEVTVPPADQLYADTLPACFEIAGTFQSTVPALETPISGDTGIEVGSTLPIPSAIAHLVVGTGAEPDRIDLRSDKKISEEQFDRAIEYWATDTAIPWTGGEIIDLPMLEWLDAYYEVCMPVDEALPLSIDPEFLAIRSIETFLPCDSVLLPEGCLDPGLEARQFSVTVEIAGAFDAYGVGLAERFPTTWRVTPVEQAGFAFRPSANEWFHPGRLQAGRQLTVDYLVEVVESVTDRLSPHASCCGADTSFNGVVSTALECSERPVGGESAAYLWDCLPVLLAISRWDIEEDRLDVKLSDSISYPQLQRAIEFWKSETAVPHTCGYTVGYHMLKRITAYWLTGTPITSPLPTDPPLPCEYEGGCASASCPDGDLCHLMELQRVEDYVGIPDAPRISVEIEGVCELTCDALETTLQIVPEGGTPPLRYEWWGRGGVLLGTTDRLTVTDPGAYTGVVISVGGCRVGEQVIVTQDIEAPQASIDVGGVLGCSLSEVDLTASILGGRSPFRIEWIGASGDVLGTSGRLTVTTPGIYTVSVEGANSCVGTATATVLGDWTTPAVSAGPDKLLTCMRTVVFLEGSAQGGQAPLAFRWTNEAGEFLGDTRGLGTNEPGTYTLTVTGANGCAGSDQVVVSEDVLAPEVEAIASGPITCAAPEATLTVTVSGGRAPIDIDWFNAADEPLGSSAQILVSEVGIYRVVVTGANGCMAEASAEVVEDLEAPIVSASVSGELTCSATVVTLAACVEGGRQPHAFAWTDEAGETIASTETLEVSSPGRYEVVVTGTNGCSDRAVIEVVRDIEAPDVSASLSGELTCDVTQVTLSAAVEGGRTPYTYAWTNAQGSTIGSDKSVRVSEPGTYEIVVTGANGCTDEAMVHVQQNIEPPAVSATASDGLLTCLVTEVTLSASISGGRNPYEIEWTDASGTRIGTGPSILVNEPGIYMVTVQGANGCEGAASVSIAQDNAMPSVDLGPDTVLTCDQPETLLCALPSGGSGPFTYAWSTGCGEELDDEGPELRVVEAGTYSVVVTGSNGCFDTDSVMVSDGIDPPTIDLGPDVTLTCDQPEALLCALPSGGSGPFTYAWSTECGGELENEGPELRVVEGGTYSVIVIGAHGCFDTDSVTVTDWVDPPIIDLGPDATLTCDQPEILLCAVPSCGEGPFTYVWSCGCGCDPGDGPEICVTEAGTYSVTVTGPHGCFDTDSVTIYDGIDPPIVDLGPDRSLGCCGAAIDLVPTITGGEAPYSYAWYNECDAIIGEEASLHVTDSGTYLLIVRTAGGCIGSDSVVITD